MFDSIRKFFKKNLEPENPVKSWLTRSVLYTKYKTSNDHLFEVAIYPDTQIPATFIVKANGLVIARIWVDDNGGSLGVSDTVAPIKFMG